MCCAQKEKHIPMVWRIKTELVLEDAKEERGKPQTLRCSPRAGPKATGSETQDFRSHGSEVSDAVLSRTTCKYFT